MSTARVHWHLPCKLTPEVKQTPTTARKFNPQIHSLRDAVQIEGGINLSHLGEELQIEIKRQTPVFLEKINQKRNIKNEPKVAEKQIIVSAFLEIKNQEVEISHACEIYLSVLNRFSDESRKEIKRLTSWIE